MAHDLCSLCLDLICTPTLSVPLGKRDFIPILGPAHMNWWERVLFSPSGCLTGLLNNFLALARRAKLITLHGFGSQCVALWGNHATSPVPANSGAHSHWLWAFLFVSSVLQGGI